ncbi:MAG: sulfatase [Armatimonadota bacterium]|nr:MAG: sulfatase [Armatimonadota bacterium]
MCTVEVAIITDSGDVVAKRTATRFFSSDCRQLPEMCLEFDLASLSGELALLQAYGKVGGRWVEGANSGPAAFVAELVGGDHVEPVPLGGWNHRGDSPSCSRTIGPLAYGLRDDSGRVFCYAVRGPIWRVFRVPEEASLLLHVRPVALGGESGDMEAVALQPEPVVEEAKARAREAGDDPPDVFIYLVDALRADHLGCYGYQRDTSPNIDAFAADAVLYEDAQTVCSWTRPAVASLLTGLDPPIHGALDKCHQLAEWPVLLSEVLKEAGYRTWCVVTNPNVMQVSGFDQGYDGFLAKSMGSAQWVNDQVHRILSQQDDDRPLFLYVHTMEPHSPYSPSPNSLARFDRGFDGACDGSLDALQRLNLISLDISEADLEHLIDRYDAEIYEADQGFGEFLSLLKQFGRSERALTFFLSDHGEAFGEHGTLTHGITLSREVLRVPLIVRFPDGEFEGLRVERRVSLVDVFATVAARVGLEGIPGSGRTGHDLSPATGIDDSRNRAVHCQLSPPLWEVPDLLGVIDEDGYKRVIAAEAEAGTEDYAWLGLWDTRSDAGEESDLTESMPVRGAYEEQLIAEWLAAPQRVAGDMNATAAPLSEFTDEMREELRALGYLR